MLKIMVDEIAPPACRVRAADTVLSHSLRSLEAMTIQALAFRVAEHLIRVAKNGSLTA